jgi:hypothetical protein
MNTALFKVTDNCLKCPLSKPMYAGGGHRLGCIAGKDKLFEEGYASVTDKWFEDMKDGEIVIPPDWCQLRKNRIIIEKI